LSSFKKRRTAEEIRKAEEARLQAKFIDLQLGQTDRRSSLFDDTTSLGSVIISIIILLPFIIHTIKKKGN
jgi:hypothetical protein